MAPPPVDTTDMSIHDEQDNWNALPGNPWPEVEEEAGNKLIPESRRFFGQLRRNAANHANNSTNPGSASASGQNGPNLHMHSFAGNPAQMNGAAPSSNYPPLVINAGNMLMAQPSFVTTYTNNPGGHASSSGGTSTGVNVNNPHSYVSPYQSVRSGGTPQFNTAHPLLGAASGSGSNAHGNTIYYPVGGPQSNSPHPLLGVASGSGSNFQGERARNCPEAGCTPTQPPEVARLPSPIVQTSTQANNNPHASLLQSRGAGSSMSPALAAFMRNNPKGLRLRNMSPALREEMMELHAQRPKRNDRYEHIFTLPAPADGTAPSMEVSLDDVLDFPGLFYVLDHRIGNRSLHRNEEVLRYDGPAYVTDVDIAEFFAGDEHYDEAINTFINAMPGEFAEAWKVAMWLKTWFNVDKGFGVGGLYQEKELTETFCKRVELTGRDLKEAKAPFLVAWFRVLNHWNGGQILPEYVVRQIADDVQRARMINAVRRGVPGVLENHRRVQGAAQVVLEMAEKKDEGKKGEKKDKGKGKEGEKNEEKGKGKGKERDWGDDGW